MARALGGVTGGTTRRGAGAHQLRPRRRLALAGAGTAGALGVLGLAVARRKAGTRTSAAAPDTRPGRHARQGRTADAVGTTTAPFRPAPGGADRPRDEARDPAAGQEAGADRGSETEPENEADGSQARARGGQRSSSLVRPRPMWAGVLLLLAGMVVAGWAVWRTSTPWAVAGVALLLVGGVLAWWGGVMADAQSGRSPQQEAVDVVEGRQHSGVDAGDEIRDPEARETARRLSHRKHAFEARAEAVEGRWQPVVAFTLLLLGAWLVTGIFVLGYPYSGNGQDGVNRAIGAGVGLILCATWIRNARRGRIAAGIALVIGVLLVLGAFLLEHDLTQTVYQEAVVGVLVVIAATSALIGRPR